MQHDDNTRLLKAELYPYPSLTPENSIPIDWRTVRSVTPWLVCMFAWGIWLFFLLIPTFYGLHNTQLYPFENNLMFVMTGLVLAFASSTALEIGHLFRSALFAAVIGLLSFWF